MPTLLPKLTTKPPDAPLAVALHPLDPYWCIEQTWAMNAKRKLDEIRVGAHLVGLDRSEAATPYDPSDEALEADTKPYCVDESGIATIYLTGPMTKRPTSMSWLFGGTSTILARKAIRMAVADDTVKSIAIVIDSPGGQVAGTADLGQDIVKARQSKPVGAYIEDCGCSAAYWIACCCDFIYLNSEGITGSIGTVLVVDDTSEMYAKDGVKIHVISTGDYKGAGADGSVITDEHLADFQRVCDELNAGFLQVVSDGRKMPLAQVRKIANGQVHVGANALGLGLVDKIATIDQFYARLGGDADPDDVDPDDDQDGDNDDTILNIPPGSPSMTSTRNNTPGHTVAAGTSSTTAATRGKETNTMAKSLKETVAAWFSSGEATDEDAARVAAAALDTKPAATVTPLAAELKSPISAEDKALIDACHAAGIKSPADVEARVALAKHGETYVAEVRKDAKAQAIRAFGATEGSEHAAAIDTLPVDAVAKLAKAWSATADKQAGIDPDTGKGPARATAPAAVAVPAEHGDANAAQRPFEKLTADQQKMVVGMVGKDPAKQDIAAANFLDMKEGE